MLVTGVVRVSDHVEEDALVVSLSYYHLWHARCVGPILR